MTANLLYFIGLILAAAHLVSANGRSLLGWAVVFVALGLLLGFVQAAFA